MQLKALVALALHEVTDERCRTRELTHDYLRKTDCRNLEMLTKLVRLRVGDLRSSADDKQAKRRREIAANVGNTMPGDDADLKARYHTIDDELNAAIAARDFTRLDALVADAQQLKADVLATCKLTPLPE